MSFTRLAGFGYHRSMWVRGALFALVLGGCYSPTFDACALVCAANEACPDGFSCSNGRCAVQGSTCSPSDGALDDGVSPDGTPVICGDGMRQPGEICFKAPQTIDTGANLILDSQTLDVTIPFGDDGLDISFNGDERTLIYSIPQGQLLLGSLVIGVDPAPIVA